VADEKKDDSPEDQVDHSEEHRMIDLGMPDMSHRYGTRWGNRGLPKDIRIKKKDRK
jgi:hypothetical protein